MQFSCSGCDKLSSLKTVDLLTQHFLQTTILLFFFFVFLRSAPGLTRSILCPLHVLALPFMWEFYQCTNPYSRQTLRFLMPASPRCDAHF